MKKTPYVIAGNWKMNTTPSEAANLISTLIESGIQATQDVEVLVCPPFLSIPAVVSGIGTSGIQCGAQDCSHEDSGAFTGQVSAVAIQESGCSHVLVGHSERRQYQGETNALCNAKILSALRQKLTAVYCIGETAEQRANGEMKETLQQQIKQGLHGVTDCGNIIIAYEPVWAIGQQAATPEQIRESHAVVRTELVGMFGATANTIKILYGGSLNADNAAKILAVEHVNGGLIGGASLKPDAFASIVGTAKELQK